MRTRQASRRLCAPREDAHWEENADTETTCREEEMRREADCITRLKIICQHTARCRSGHLAADPQTFPQPVLGPPLPLHKGPTCLLVGRRQPLPPRAQCSPTTVTIQR